MSSAAEMKPVVNGAETTVKEEQTLPPLSRAEFDIYNSLAVRMDAFVRLLVSWLTLMLPVGQQTPAASRHDPALLH